MADNTQIPPVGSSPDDDKTKIFKKDVLPDDNQKGVVGGSPATDKGSAPVVDNSAQTPKDSTMTNEDKTIFQSGSVQGAPKSDMPRSSAVHPSPPEDYTQVDRKTNLATDPRQAQTPPVQPNEQTSTSNSKTEELKASLNKPKKSGGVSTGAAIGGAAAAGVAGVAFGTGYSEQIKDGIANLGQLGSESTEAQAGGTSEQDPETGASPTAGIQTDEVIPTAGGSHSATGTDDDYIAVNYTDHSGNAYGIYVSDLNQDGKMDYVETDITSVDGSNIHITASGQGLINMLQEGMSMALPEDYIDQGGFIIPASLVEQSTSHDVYDIVPGDTLSEIAAAHNTSIVNLLELNPGITDPDMIVAGEQIIIPIGDNISDPYEGYQEYLDGVTYVVPPVDISIVHNPGVEPIDDLPVDGPLPDFLFDPDDNTPADEDLGLEEGEGEFQPVDWASFDQAPVAESQSEYLDLIENTDFDSFDSQTIYTSENYDSLSDSTDVASEFL